MGSPDYQGEEKLEYLVKGMKLYEQAGVDFLEINESCPNTSHGKPQDDDLSNRLRHLKENFLDQRERKLPVIVKFSNDTETEQVPELMDLLFELGYDGVNFGNTSTKYEERKKMISSDEHKLYETFIETYGGGVSGRPLAESSFLLAAIAVQQVKEKSPSQEFHVIRTGGTESWEDIAQSEAAGISLNQWYTGYFENFSQQGHKVYEKLFQKA